jgi:3-deoxy-D-manno-octulosonate 8-phosphate phosphatase KdsC-like HAD superfamily phosphatase
MGIADSENINSFLQEAIRKIRLIAFDFDGVFTDNMVYVLVQRQCVAIAATESGCRN